MITNHLLRLLGLGIVTGLLFRPVYDSVFRVALRLLSGWRFPLLISLLGGCIAGTIAVVVLLLVPAKLLGLIPMQGSAPLFVVAFLSGAVAQRLVGARSRRRPSRDDFRL